LENDPVYLTVNDVVASAAIEDILQQNGIPCEKQGMLGQGIQIGFLYESYRFFVPYGAYDKAREVIANFLD
jgi:hypothetical protein